jgi:hypothetical protein
VRELIREAGAVAGLGTASQTGAEDTAAPGEASVAGDVRITDVGARESELGRPGVVPANA